MPRIERIDAVALVGAAVDEAEVAASQSDTRLEIDAPDHAWVRADMALLRRVADNLLSNAIAHSPTGGTVEVTVCPRPEGIEIAVTDEGPGIPEEQREQVFDKYAQLGDNAMSGSNRGLGLTFCRLVVEAQGGTIWVDAAPGGGACFRTVLPDAGAGEAEPAESAESAALHQR